MIKEIKNDKLKQILTKRGEVFEKIHKINEKLMELDKERKKEAYKMDKLKDKTATIMDKEGIKLEEFEVITRIFLEDDECKYEVINQLEEYSRPITQEEIEEYKTKLREKDEGTSNKKPKGD